MCVVAEATRRRRALESSIRRRDWRRIIREQALHRQDIIFGTNTRHTSWKLPYLCSLAHSFTRSQIARAAADSHQLALQYAEGSRRRGCDNFQSKSLRGSFASV